MFTIRLNKLIFFAYHGVHEEEAIVGGEFEVSAQITFAETKKVEALTDTLNYVNVFTIIKDHFSRPVPLLETLAQNISEEIYKIDNRITSINVTIDKLNAPICNFTGTVGINYSKSFS